MFFKLLQDPSNVRYFLSSEQAGSAGQSVSSRVPRISAPTKLKRTELRINYFYFSFLNFGISSLDERLEGLKKLYNSLGVLEHKILLAVHAVI